MSETAIERNKRLVLEFLEVLARRDAQATLARMTEKPAWKVFGAERRGQDGVRSILKAASELYRAGSLQREITGLVAEGDTVVVQSTLRAKTFKDEPYENYYVLVVRLEEGKIASVHEYLDTAYANRKFEGWKES